MLGLQTTTLKMKSAITDACYRGQRLGDTRNPSSCSRPAPFGEMTFKAFAAKHGAKLVMMAHAAG